MNDRERLLERAVAALEGGEELAGICIQCGASDDRTDPGDAAQHCSACGLMGLYNMEDIVIMFA